MGHKSISRSRESRERSRHKKSVHKHSYKKHKPYYKYRSRSRSTSSDTHYRRESKHSHTSHTKKHFDRESCDSSSHNSEFDRKLEPDAIQHEFEVSNFTKAYGLDLSGFVGLPSEILNVTSASEDKKLNRFERKKLREHELKHHQERFWKCKKCDFMNYLSNYECKRCKGLRASCAS